MVDFAKAFDRVSHAKLIDKLISIFGFSQHAASLIQSYLSERSQCVYHNDCYSLFELILSGVPQGSVLGPLLFSLFINDLPSILDHCLVHLFADDVQIYYCAKKNSNNLLISNEINHDLAKVHHWSENNFLPINPSKTKALLISNLKTPPSPPPLVMSGERIEFFESANNLGIIFNSNLDWSSHINAQVGKVYGTLKKLNLITKNFDIATKLKLFKTLIYPHFIYGDFVLSNASVAALDRLRVALNACVRYVYNLSRYDSVTNYQSNLLGCPFSQFIKFRSSVTLFRIIHSKKPNYLFTKLVPFRNPRTNNFIIPNHSSAYYNGSLFARGVSTWNSLPTNLKSCRNIPCFKRQLLNLLND